ncbi:MAG: STAS domain-containing protein [Bacteroidia bacterium]|nr:STAS domain-containing protein [Bacteroidia bacterium]
MKFEKNLEELYTSITILEEKLDSRIAPILKGEFVMLNTEGVRSIILNLTHIKYVDSSGLSAILIGHRLCEDSGGAFVLCHLNEHVEKLVHISQLNSFLNIISTEKEAIEAIFMAEMESQLESDSEEGKDEVSIDNA